MLSSLMLSSLIEFEFKEVFVPIELQISEFLEFMNFNSLSVLLSFRFLEIDKSLQALSNHQNSNK